MEGATAVTETLTYQATFRNVYTPNKGQSHHRHCSGTSCLRCRRSNCHTNTFNTKNLFRTNPQTHKAQTHNQIIEQSPHLNHFVVLRMAFWNAISWRGKREDFQTRSTKERSTALILCNNLSSNMITKNVQSSKTTQQVASLHKFNTQSSNVRT